MRGRWQRWNPIQDSISAGGFLYWRTMYYDPIECGMRISRLRMELGFTQAQAAEKLNISVQHYRSVEVGRRGASIDLLVDISILYHTSLDYLILGKHSEMRLGRIKKELRSIIEGLETLENAL